MRFEDRELFNDLVATLVGLGISKKRIGEVARKDGSTISRIEKGTYNPTHEMYNLLISKYRPILETQNFRGLDIPNKSNSNPGNTAEILLLRKKVSDLEGEVIDIKLELNKIKEELNKKEG